MYERLGYVKQLVFSRTKLEFRLLWNKVFQREDEELGWLLSPYRSSGNSTMMSQLNRNTDGNDYSTASYQYGYDDVSGSFGREKVTIYNRSVSKRPNRKGRKQKEEKKTFTENALQYAKYMGMGVYMTSTSFPSPFFPVNDTNLYNYNEPNYYYEKNVYTMSKIW